MTTPHTRTRLGAQWLISLCLLSLTLGWGMDAQAQERKVRPGKSSLVRPANKARSGARPWRQYRAYRQEATKFLRTASKQARVTFNGPGSRGALTALGAVLTRTNMDRNLLRKVVNNPHALIQKDPKLQPTIFPAVKAMARLGNIKGTNEVLKRAALSVKDEGGTRGALFELVAGSAVKRMGYKLDGLSHQIGKYETDGKVDNGSKLATLVNMKSISQQRVMDRTVSKAEDQLRLRNGTANGRPRDNRNPALLVIGQMPGVDLAGWNWKETAKRTGSDLTVIRVDPNTGRGREIYRAGRDQHKLLTGTK